MIHVTKTETKDVDRCQECPYFAEDIDMGAIITICSKKGMIGLDLRNYRIDPRCPYLREEQELCSNGNPCTHPNCKRCGTTHFMSECDYEKEHKE